MIIGFFFFKQKTAYEMRISDWSSDVCSSDLIQIQDRAAGEEDRPCEVDLAPDSVGQLNRFLRQPREQHAIADQMAAEQRQREHRVNHGRFEFDEARVVHIDRQADEHERDQRGDEMRSEEHTSELQSLMRNSYAVFCLNKKID